MRPIPLKARTAHRQLSIETFHRCGAATTPKTATDLWWAPSHKDHAKRATDVAARYGGEEFFLLLPHTTASDAYLLGERIRGAMHTQAIPHPTTDVGIVTLSIGVTAVVPEHGEHGPRGATSLVEAANCALYDAKHGGRDAVRTASAEYYLKPKS